MHHPIILLIPGLMILDYLLTILGAREAARAYRNHILSPSYELNPTWRQSVEKLQWFNTRHCIGVCIVTSVLVLADLRFNTASSILPFAHGILFGALGCVTSTHISNLLTFSFVARHPNELSGQSAFSHLLVLNMSLFDSIGLLLPFSLVALLAPGAYTFGMLSGVAASALTKFAWTRNEKARLGKKGSIKVPPQKDS